MPSSKKKRQTAKSTEKSNKRKKKGRKSLASQADKHVLYEQSVQCVEAEIDFVDKTYKKLRGRRAVWLREDFCGTANTSCEWIRRRDGNRAVGVDLDPEPLEWGRQHNVQALGEKAERLTLLQEDVLEVDTLSRFGPMDVILAMNFSYWIFQERATMRRYFQSVLEALADDGVMMLDACGGSEMHELREDTREYEDYAYVWDQAEFSPITHDMQCYIHFEFPDGSKMRKAFAYRWRLWSLPEIRDLLLEAGFSNVTVYWEGTERKTGEGNGVFKPSEKGEPCPSWIAYIVAEK
jgi:SAM-dependent methyltransferase